jgi:hypothetical protein
MVTKFNCRTSHRDYLEISNEEDSHLLFVRVKENSEILEISIDKQDVQFLISLLQLHEIKMD